MQRPRIDEADEAKSCPAEQVEEPSGDKQKNALDERFVASFEAPDAPRPKNTHDVPQAVRRDLHSQQTAGELDHAHGTAEHVEVQRTLLQGHSYKSLGQTGMGARRLSSKTSTTP